MAIRYLSRADVESVGLSAVEVIDILEGAFRAKRAGDVEMPPKVGVHPREDAFIHAMPAYLSDTDSVGLKWVAGYPSNQPLGIPYIHGLFVLSDAATGRPLAVMDATWITEVRTAAASILGIRALADRPVESIGILGCGRQGHVHLELAEQVFPTLRRVALFDRQQRPGRCAGRGASRPRRAGDSGGRGDRARSGRDRLHRRDRAPARAAAPASAPGGCDGRVRGRLRRDPLRGPLRGAAVFVVDDLAQYRYYRQQGYFAGYPADALELADVLADEAPRPPGLAVYAPLGLALEDVAVAAELNRRAADAGVGRELPL